LLLLQFYVSGTIRYVQGQRSVNSHIIFCDWIISQRDAAALQESIPDGYMLIRCGFMLTGTHDGLGTLARET